MEADPIVHRLAPCVARTTHLKRESMNIPSQTRDTAPCPICHKCDYEWGFVKERHGLTYLKGVERLGSMLISGEKLSARSCLECGHVILFRKKSKM